MEIAVLKKHLNLAHERKEIFEVVARAFLEIPVGDLEAHLDEVIEVYHLVDRPAFTHAITVLFRRLDEAENGRARAADAVLLNFISSHYHLLDTYKTWHPDLECRFNHWLYHLHAGSHTHDHCIY